ncbi:MAG: hypothetical protein IJP66_10210, partial [Kiritimatiellae bacterium]|nr:hypothetical protein [Kiritimatiellia bacterium]
LAAGAAARTARGRGVLSRGLAPPLRLFPLAALAALLLVSLVEYNLADAAVVVLYGVVMGLAAPAGDRQEAGCAVASRAP